LPAPTSGASRHFTCANCGPIPFVTDVGQDKASALLGGARPRFSHKQAEKGPSALSADGLWGALGEVLPLRRWVGVVTIGCEGSSRSVRQGVQGKITTWVDERTASVLRGLAAEHGVSLSELCARKLKASVEEHAGEVGTEVVVPAVRASVRREVRRMGDRLAHLLARSALESAAARRVAFQLLAEELGVEEANRRNKKAAWKGSVESLKKPAEGLREILEEGAPRDGAPRDGAGAATGGGRAPDAHGGQGQLRAPGERREGRGEGERRLLRAQARPGRGARLQARV
jgi:hypothetical protein